MNPYFGQGNCYHRTTLNHNAKTCEGTENKQLNCWATS